MKEDTVVLKCYFMYQVYSTRLFLVWARLTFFCERVCPTPVLVLKNGFLMFLETNEPNALDYHDSVNSVGYIACVQLEIAYLRRRRTKLGLLSIVAFMNLRIPSDHRNLLQNSKKYKRTIV